MLAMIFATLNLVPIFEHDKLIAYTCSFNGPFYQARIL